MRLWVHNIQFLGSFLFKACIDEDNDPKIILLQSGMVTFTLLIVYCQWTIFRLGKRANLVYVLSMWSWFWEIVFRRKDFYVEYFSILMNGKLKGDWLIFKVWFLCWCTSSIIFCRLSSIWKDKCIMLQYVHPNYRKCLHVRSCIYASSYTYY